MPHSAGSTAVGCTTACQLATTTTARARSQRAAHLDALQPLCVCGRNCAGLRRTPPAARRPCASADQAARVETGGFKAVQARSAAEVRARAWPARPRSTNAGRCAPAGDVCEPWPRWMCCSWPSADCRVPAQMWAGPGADMREPPIRLVFATAARYDLYDLWCAEGSADHRRPCAHVQLSVRSNRR